MKKYYSRVFRSLIILMLSAKFGFSAIGDTTFVQALNAVAMTNYGNYSQWTNFPAPGTSYGKIIMQYKLGCPPTGCSPWDYTTQITARVKTGTFDSTLTQYPISTADGSAYDTLYCNVSPVYVYSWNSSTGSVDSAFATPILVRNYSDSLNPTVITDSAFVFPGNFYNYLYNSSGVIIDSVLVGYSQILYGGFYNEYNVFEVLESFEFGRVMTPYATGYPLSWNRDFWYDVTDYASILHDSVLINAFYDGYSSGFSATVNFYFIEGTPSRSAIRVRNIYPLKYYEYGITTNPVENYLVPKKFEILPNERLATLRVTPSGHSFGGAQNCAEFCIKNYRWVVDGSQRFTQQMWRNDCGMNPVMAQPGTWLYDRSNWCPGDRAIVRTHDLSPFLVPGDSIQLDMNLDPYTYSGGAGFNPGYYLSSHLITYDSINFQVNAAMDEIVAPNIDLNYGRFNPICTNPIVIIKNEGALPLTSCTINFGIEGGVIQTYAWTGNLAFNQRDSVRLGNLTWGSSTGTPNKFKCWITNPNGGTDQYAYNDTLRSTTNFTTVLPPQFQLYWKTNSAANETTYKLIDESGFVLYSNITPLTANTVYRDTFTLVPGCYELRISDSGKDGLSFFANSDGTGFARLAKTDGSSAFLQTIEPNFGTSISVRFTVTSTVGVEEQKISDAIFEIAPNPANSRFAINLILPKKEDVEIEILNQLGQKVYSSFKPQFLQEIIEIDLSTQSKGMYFVNVRANGKVYTKKLILE